MNSIPHSQELSKYHEMLVGYFAKRGCGDDSGDLVQDVMLKACRGLHRFRGDASLKTWLFQIARNTLIEHQRFQGKVSLLNLEDSPEEDLRQAPNRVPEKNPEKKMVVDEGLRVLGLSVENLPPRMRQVLLLRMAQDMKYHDIARLLGVNINTVKSNLNHARTRLRDELDGYYDDIMGGAL